jgi:protein TonB
MRLVTSLPPALLITLTLFFLMQYLIGTGRPGLARPDYPGFVRLIRVTPDHDDPRQPTQPLPERPALSARAPSAPAAHSNAVEAPQAPALAVKLPERVPLDLGDGPSLDAFDPVRGPPEHRVEPRQVKTAPARSQPDKPGGATAPSLPPANGGPTAGLDDAGGGDVVALFRVDPVYPRKAARNGDEGWVKVEFTITELGSVVDPVVVDARPRRTFNRAAVAAIRQWRFKPRLVSGKPVAVRATQVIEFKLAKR